VATASVSPRPASPSRLERVTGGAGALTAITVLALALRLATLSGQSFWLDESYTVHLVRLGLGPMLRTIPQTESTPPLYYVLAWAWTHVFGSSEYGLRSLSALAGTGTVFVGGRIAGRIGGRGAELIAAGLLAVSPLLLWFSQESRAYALAALLAAGSLLCLITYAETNARRPLAGWAALSALALCTHYFTVFPILPGALWLLWSARRRREVRGALATVTLVALVLVPLALAQRGTGHADYIARGALGTRILQVPKQLLIGYASPAQLVTGILALLLLLAGAGWSLAAGRRRLVSTPVRLTLATASTGVLLPIALAVAGIDFLNTRNLLPAFAPLVAVAAVGFAGPTARRWGPWCAAGLIAVFTAVVVLVDTHPAYQRPDFRDAVQALGPLSAPRVLLVSPANGLLPIQAYAPDVGVLSTSATVTELDVVDVAAQPAPTTPPGPLAGIAAPAGFARVGSIVRPAYTLVRYRAPAPTTVSAVPLAALPVGPNREVAIQTPPQR